MLLQQSEETKDRLVPGYLPVIFSPFRSLLLIPLIFAALLLAAAAAPALGEQIRVRDSRGKLFTLPAPPKRIVSVAPSNTEILFALGLGRQMVGATDYCSHPPQARSLQKVGGIQLNYERILSLKPDMVLAVTNLQKTSIARMEALGLPVFTIDPHTVEETIAAIELVGRAAGSRAAAARVAGRMRTKLASVRKAVAGRSERPGVLTIIQLQPLIVAGPNTFMDDCIRLAGGRNVASDARGPYPIFSVEQAVLRKPEVIFTSPRNRQALLNSPVWRAVPAVSQGRIYHPEQDLVELPGPRLADGVEALARFLHPDAFPTPKGKPK
jgi:iron complex transport system substrate-binding protein